GRVLSFTLRETGPGLLTERVDHAGAESLTVPFSSVRTGLFPMISPLVATDAPATRGIAAPMIFSAVATRVGVSRTTSALLTVLWARYLMYKVARSVVIVSVRRCGDAPLGR